MSVQEPFVVEAGFNKVFAELENWELMVRPSGRGFSHQLMCFRKRSGLLWSENWETTGDIRWAWYFNSILYPYTDSGYVYSFDGNDMTTLVSSWLTYNGTDYSSDTLKLSFLGGGRYPDASTEFTVSSYSGQTITTVETTLTSSYIGKYIYISSGAAAGLRQVRGINNIVSNNQIVLDAGLDVNPTAGDKIQIFNEIKTQIWYPQLRKTADQNYLYGRDTEGNDLYWYFPNARKIIRHDNRLIQLHKNRQNILGSDSRSYEIIDLTKLVSLDADALNIVSHSGYIIVFFDDRIGVLKKKIVDDTTGAFIYEYQDCLNTWLYSENSFYVNGSDMYFFGNDNRLYSVDVNLWTNGQVILKTTPQAEELRSIFDQIDGGEVIFRYSLGKIRMAHIKDSETQTWVYYVNIGWIPNRYTWFVDNFMRFRQFLSGDEYTCHENKIYKITGLLDDNTNIRSYIKLYGPVSSIDSLINIGQCKIMLWNNGNPIGGTVRYSVGWNVYATNEKTVTSIGIIDRINQYTLESTTLGSQMVGDVVLGGEPWFWEVIEYFDEYILIAKKIGKMWWNVVVEIENDTERDLVFCWAMLDYTKVNSSSVPPNNLF